eukprot:6891203-Pyramimonas_sp.AAC.1
MIGPVRGVRVLEEEPPVVEPVAPPPPPPVLPAFSPAPPPSRPFRFLLHLFSGQRRANDVQDWIERLVAQYPTPVVVLSIDIANSPKYGDLSDVST